jgi:hypothetical protein
MRLMILDSSGAARPKVWAHGLRKLAPGTQPVASRIEVGFKDRFQDQYGSSSPTAMGPAG